MSNVSIQNFGLSQGCEVLRGIGGTLSVPLPSSAWWSEIVDVCNCGSRRKG